MLLELAIGDAYGAGFEYADRAFVSAHNDLTGYVRHPRHRHSPGSYTDDTQMSLAIAEAIVEDDPWTPETLAERFVDAFKRDPRQGYAQGFYGLLKRVSSGRELLSEIRPDSDKSGAAMRATPIGVYGNLDEVVERATAQAAITHNTPAGISAAVAAALMAHYFVHSVGPQSDLGQWLCYHVPGDWRTPYLQPVGSKGWMSVLAAVTLVGRATGMSALLRSCIALTGDVDTVATIALSAASWCPQIRRDIPQCLVDGLERGSFGRAYLETLDTRLMGRAGPRS